jgi:16S rRNA (guanine(966)-N(2))-methyltransferase RsmD
MRIIAGERKGMRLEAPVGTLVRPSSDKLRGAVMSQLGGFFDGERVLDVCAGTGAIALEFLSRGAGLAVALEQDPTALAALKHNAAHTRLADRLEVLPGDAVAGLGRLAGRQFDYVYVDPPYDAGLHAPLLAALLRHDLLTPTAQVLVESRHGLTGLDGWRVVLARRYGSSVLQRLERA